jgi:predicted phosphodiesterase
MVLSDVHIPEHDRSFWRSALLWIKDNKPTEIILSGDFAELASVSQHGGANEQKLIDDLTSIKQALDELREMAGESCTITYLEGNHESRLPRALASWAPTFTGAFDLPGMLELEKRNIEWVPEYKQPVHRGLLRVLHGHQVLGKYGPKHHAAKAADVYGSSPHCEILYGHVHAAQQFSKPVAGGYVSASAVGCGRTIGSDQVRWLAGREAGWHHGFAVVYVTDSFAQVYNIKVRDGRFVWHGKLYDGSEAAHVAASAR